MINLYLLLLLPFFYYEFILEFMYISKFLYYNIQIYKIYKIYE